MEVVAPNTPLLYYRRVSISLETSEVEVERHKGDSIVLNNCKLDNEDSLLLEAERESQEILAPYLKKILLSTWPDERLLELASLRLHLHPDYGLGTDTL